MLKDHLDSKELKKLDESQKDNFYKGDYLEFDHFGYKHVKCMKCGTVVMHREKQKKKCPHCGRMVEFEGNLMRKLPNYRQVEKNLDDGSYMAIICCEGCAPSIVNASEEEEERITTVVRAGWINEMEFANKPAHRIKHLLSRKKLKIKRKAEKIQEVIDG